MLHVLETGTDAGSLLLFDPGALPDEFDVRMQDDPAEMLNRLTDEGMLYWINTGGDGAFCLHVYIEEPIPDSLKQVACDPITVDNFSVPTGRLYFTGVEYGFKNDDRLLRKYPLMGNAAKIPAGNYRLTLFRTDYPEGFHEALLRKNVSKFAYYLHESMGWFVWLAILACISFTISFFILSLSIWLALVVPVSLPFMAGPFILYRLPVFRVTSEQYNELQRSYPSIVASLARNDAC